MFIDTHTHLNFAAFTDDWRVVADRAVAAGVEQMIVVGADVETSRRAVELAEQHPALFAAVGIHPHHAQDMDFDAELKIIEELAGHERVVAIGEIGLDRHEYTQTKYEKPADYDIQKSLFVEQISLADRLDMPVIMHSREVGEDVLALARGARGVFHCFDGSKKYLKRILEAGFYVSFTGNITFVDDRAQVALQVPLDRLLIETDSPYMTPAPHRGERNEPAHVILVAANHATMRSIQLDEVARQTTLNAQGLFGI